MNLLVKLAKIAGYGQTLRGGKDLFNSGAHIDPSKSNREEFRKGGKDLFNGGAHRGKPHRPRHQHPHLDHSSGEHEWCY